MDMINTIKRTWILALLILSASGTLEAASGDLVGMGGNDYGQLALGDYRLGLSVIAEDISKVASSDLHSLILTESGDLYAVGSNSHSQLGAGGHAIEATPVYVDSDVVEIAAGHFHSLYLKQNGELYGMGWNNSGQLGLRDHEFEPVPVLIAVDAQSIACGRNFSLWIDRGNRLWGLGQNNHGQLNVEDNSVSEPTVVAEDVLKVAAGYNHALFVTIDNKLFGIGRNSVGQLGNGTFDDTQVPVYVSGDVSDVYANYSNSAFITTTGSLYAMGHNGYEQVIPEDVDSVSNPTLIARDIVKAAVGENHLLMLNMNGEVLGRGFALYGQLGDETGRTYSNSRNIEITSSIEDIAAGRNHSMFIEAKSGNLYAMGDNIFGQLGQDSHAVYPEKQWLLGQNATQVSCGSAYTVYITDQGELWGMGFNHASQLGVIGLYQHEPIKIVPSGSDFSPLGQAKVAQVATGNRHTLFVTTTGDLYVMGSHAHGQLGVGDANRAYSPVKIASKVAGVAAGNQHSLYWTTSGDLYAFGRNDKGQLGDGTTVSRTTPVLVARNVSHAAGGFDHSLFIAEKGNLYAMGSNEYGQLGHSNAAGGGSLKPVFVTSGVFEVEAGFYHSLYIGKEKELFGFGDNRKHQLSSRNTDNYPSSVRLAYYVEEFAAGSYNTYYVNSDRWLYGMGYNNYGQLGNGSILPQSFAVHSADNVHQVAAGHNHCVFTLYEDSIELHKHNYITTVEIDNSWSLDPNDVLNGKVDFNTAGDLGGLKILNNMLEGKMKKAGIYSFTVEAQEQNSADAVTSQFNVLVLEASDTPVFIGASVYGGKFIPVTTRSSIFVGDLPELNPLHITIRQPETTEIRIVTDCIDTKPNFKIVEGRLPEDLYLDQDTGIIWGIPMEQGEFRFTIAVSDKRGYAKLDVILTIE